MTEQQKITAFLLLPPTPPPLFKLSIKTAPPNLLYSYQPQLNPTGGEGERGGEGRGEESQQGWGGLGGVGGDGTGWGGVGWGGVGRRGGLRSWRGNTLEVHKVEVVCRKVRLGWMWRCGRMMKST